MVSAFYVVCLLLGGSDQPTPAQPTLARPTTAQPTPAKPLASATAENSESEPAAPPKATSDPSDGPHTPFRRATPTRMVPVVGDRSALAKKNEDDAPSDPFAARVDDQVAPAAAQGERPPLPAGAPNVSGSEPDPRGPLPPSPFPAAFPASDPAEPSKFVPATTAEPRYLPGGDAAAGRPPSLLDDEPLGPFERAGSLEPAGSVRRTVADDVRGAGSSRGELPPPDDMGALVPVRPQNTSEAQRLVGELFGSSPPPPVGSVAGDSGNIALKDVLQRAAAPSERLALVHAYWRLAGLAAERRIADRYAARIDELAELYRRSGNNNPPAELTAAAAAVAARREETEVLRLEAAARLGASSATSSAQLLPGDLPHAGTYRTEFDRMFGDRPAPPRLELLDRLLPLRQQAVASRAESVRAVTDAVAASEESFQRGELTLGRLLFQMRRQAEEQLRFLQAVEVYNDEIAEYALSATGGQLPIATLAETLVKDPQEAKLPPPAATPIPMYSPAGEFPAPGSPTYGPGTFPTGPVPLGPTPMGPAPRGPSPAGPSPAGPSPTSAGATGPLSSQTSDALPGHSILKATSTLPVNEPPTYTPAGGTVHGPVNPALRPIPTNGVPPQGQNPRYTPPAAFQPYERPRTLPTSPTSSPTPTPTSRPALPMESPQPMSPSIPTDRTTLRPLSETDAGQLATLRDAVYRNLIPGAREVQANRPGEVSSQVWTWIERSAAARILLDQTNILATLESTTLNLRQRPLGGLSLLMVRAARVSVQADADAMKPEVAAAEATVRERHGASATSSVPIPRMPPSTVNADDNPWKLAVAQSVRLGAVAIMETNRAAELALSQFASQDFPAEDVIDAVALHRRSSLEWLANVTRYQALDP